ncbi:MAG TPA: hypothetical protein VNT58_06350 [Gaiellaceae bacterium]|nr:hypothetical protein [Gaiellaceae bacterium]
MDVAPELLERLDRVIELDRRRRAAAALDAVLVRELLDELRTLVAATAPGTAAAHGPAGGKPAGDAAGNPRGRVRGGEVVERPARRLQET